jgi:hypothetical protein
MACCAALMTLLPIGAYGLLLILGLIAFGDPGGWLNLILVPLISAAVALLGTGLLCPLALLLQRLRMRRRFPAWLPLALAYPAAFTLLAFALLAGRARLPTAPELAGVALASLLLSCGFGAYWVPLLASEALLRRLRRP